MLQMSVLKVMGGLLRLRASHFGFTILVLLLVVNLPVAAAANEKYAAIVVDTDTNTVLHQANPDAQRHPASLTKMMTLYLTFEALQQGKLSLRQQLTASQYAASRPQTNLSLKQGDKIDVDTAIKALVVRSANDVSVILAEAIDKTEWQFAVRMTNKARQLGMNKTVFKNANGLPDVRQVTTARDFAKLSIALRRDFPQYYHYFKVTEFDFHGRNYQTHNRVMRDYPGADGLKTGYINMSGFNLATSVRRDGYSIVAVVMGGKTSRSRDDHMKDLLNRSLRQLAESKKPGGANVNNFASMNAPDAPPSKTRTAPIPRFKPGTEPAAVATASTNIIAPIPSEADGIGDVASAQDISVQQTLRAAGIVQNQPTATYTPEVRKARTDRGNWGIQVGAFGESRDAFMAAANAMSLASRELEGAEINVVAPSDAQTRIFRARIANMDEAQARRACKVLTARKEACFVYQGGN